MSVNWTQDQQQVISLRDRNILVSAAAGSGKTAVLVERIIQKITDPNRPIDVDRLLIMTFTRAAAGEMKERLSLALEAALNADPDNEHLQRQMTLIHNAQITTIDGFCGYILRNYFHLIDLDPGYRVADEGELRLMKEDVMEEVLEDAYQKAEPGFIAFVESYADGKDDKKLSEYVLRLYEASQSHPDPAAWLDKCRQAYEIKDQEALRNSPFYKMVVEISLTELEYARELLEKAQELCHVPGGPFHYDEAISSDLCAVRDIMAGLKEGDYGKICHFYADWEPAPLSRKRPKEVEASLREQVKELRDQAKAAITELGESYYPSSLDILMQEFEILAGHVDVVCGLAENFSAKFAEKKQDKNLLDFSDMEHFALKILHEGEDSDSGDDAPAGGDTAPDEAAPDGADTSQVAADAPAVGGAATGKDSPAMSPAARELSLRFDEVLVDEYQDSNEVQEALTQAVSGWVNGRNNIFMVGDVKQSIYGFRQACPHLFMEKYKTYTSEDGPKQKIDLHKNFRSRSEVLDSVNDIFCRIMTEDLGGVTYDDRAALHYGADYSPVSDPDFNRTEILLIDKDMEEDDTAPAETFSAQQLEALTIGLEIEKIVGHQEVIDKETKTPRKIGYGDIAILLRTATGWAEEFIKVLNTLNIPARTTSSTGYFSATEVVTMLNYLRILDNPRQDYPLAGVLRSPIAGLTSQEMAEIRARYKEGMLWDSIMAYMEDAPGGSGLAQDSGAAGGSGLAQASGTAGGSGLAPAPDATVGSGPAPALGAASGSVPAPGTAPVQGQAPGPAPAPGSDTLQKLRAFLDTYTTLRNRASYTPIHQLITEALRLTGYGDYAAALPGGAQRHANLNMLSERARDYEKTSYRGLFNFIRYIEKLQKYEMDFGEVNISGGAESAVTIMTIHKSKGLEFPVVFCAGMGKQFNMQDINSSMLIHRDFGLGLDLSDPEKRLRCPSVYKQVMKYRMKRDTLGEELRVLYVALTRAKEKLYITGCVGKLDKLSQNLSRSAQSSDPKEPISMGIRMKSRNYLDFILNALAASPDMNDFYREYGQPTSPRKEGKSLFDIKTIHVEYLVTDRMESDIKEDSLKEDLLNWDPEKVYNPELRTRLDQTFGYVYPYTFLKDIPTKVSVSDLKKRRFADEEELEENIYAGPGVLPPADSMAAEAPGQYTCSGPEHVGDDSSATQTEANTASTAHTEEEDFEPYIPNFIKEREEGISGAGRGTAYHKVMECLDYAKADTTKDIKAQIQALIKEGKLTDLEARFIRPRDILSFTQSPLGVRMARAASEGRLRREQPFVFSLPASELNPAWTPDQKVLVQGIIDAYFYEGDDIILVDYKTDRIFPGQEDKLRSLYQIQLNDYAQALEQLEQKKVTETYIYSFALNKPLPL